MASLRRLAAWALLAAAAVRAQDNWQVTYRDVGADAYELVMEWDHNTTKSLVIESGVRNPGNQDGSHDAGNSQGVCDPDSGAVAPTDGQPYWVPRFYPRSVPAEVTRKTGIQFASVDWQPCGHKDVVICHAESHYDFHLYYVPLAELRGYTCTDPNPTCHLGRVRTEDDGTSDARFFKLMSGNLPVRYGSSNVVDFCVDPTSAMPESGIHYGDRDETTQEWRTPVTIMGSYDCKLTFFEPMVSWKWIKGSSSSAPWPRWDSGEITYDQKTYHPLPTSWSVEVSDTCRTVPGGNDCHIKITVNGLRCDGSTGCGPLPQSCGRQRNCLNNELIGVSPTTSTGTGTSTSTGTGTSTGTLTSTGTSTSTGTGTGTLTSTNAGTSTSTSDMGTSTGSSTGSLRTSSSTSSTMGNTLSAGASVGAQAAVLRAVAALLTVRAATRLGL